MTGLVSILAPPQPAKHTEKTADNSHNNGDANPAPGRRRFDGSSQLKVLGCFFTLDIDAYRVISDQRIFIGYNFHFHLFQIPRFDRIKALRVKFNFPDIQPPW
jgi:hypothetical protein